MLGSAVDYLHIKSIIYMTFPESVNVITLYQCKPITQAYTNQVLFKEF